MPGSKLLGSLVAEGAGASTSDSQKNMQLTRALDLGAFRAGNDTASTACSSNLQTLYV